MLRSPLSSRIGSRRTGSNARSEPFRNATFLFIIEIEKSLDYSISPWSQRTGAAGSPEGRIRKYLRSPIYVIRSLGPQHSLHSGGVTTKLYSFTMQVRYDHDAQYIFATNNLETSSSLSELMFLTRHTCVHHPQERLEGFHRRSGRQRPFLSICCTSCCTEAMTAWKQNSDWTQWCCCVGWVWTRLFELCASTSSRRPISLSKPYREICA